MDNEKLNALAQAVSEFSEYVAPSLLSVTVMNIDSNPVATGLADGFYFYNTVVNIPDSLVAGETRLSYLVQRKTESNGDVTIVAQSLLRNQLLYSNTLVGGSATGWGAFVSTPKVLINKSTGVFCYSAPLWLR